MNTISTEQQKYLGNTAIGLTGGLAAYAWCPRQVSRIFYRYCLLDNKKFSIQDNEKIWNAAQTTMTNLNLDKKVTLIDYNTNNWESIAEKSIEKYKDFIKNIKNPLLKLKALVTSSEEEIRQRLLMFATGGNACFRSGESQILVNKEVCGHAVFHEIGHALNAKGKGFGKFLANARYQTAGLAPLIFGLTMLIPYTKNDSEENNPKSKILFPLKKYAGLLVSASMLPIVAEEGYASIRAAKISKNLLSPEICKKINKSNAKSFGTYFISMGLAGIGTALAIFIKDKITGPMPLKTPPKEEDTDNQELIEK